MKVFAFVFSFEELNTNVFVNALMRKRAKNELFVAYCPRGFSPLFFSADLVIEIPDRYIKYSNYLEVSEIAGSGWAENVTQWLFARGLGLIGKLQMILKPGHLLFLSSFLRSARTNKYLFRSGAWNWVQADARSRWGGQLQYGRVVHISDYLLVTPKGLTLFRSLGQSFQFRFNELSEAIKSGMRIKSDAIWTNRHSHQAVIRTRNYLKKATMHNSNVQHTSMLCKILLRRGYQVLNIGSPPLQLDVIENASNKGHAKSGMKYVELASPPLSSEIQAIMNADFLMCQADAGLFTLIALVDKPIVTTSEEWSLLLGISLLEARANSGQEFDDLDLSSLMEEEEHVTRELHAWLDHLEASSTID